MTGAHALPLVGTVLVVPLLALVIADPPERRSLKLIYEVDRELVRECPGASTFLDALSARLGYVPPDDASAPLAIVRIKRSEGGLSGRLELESGRSPVLSEVDAGASECRSLIDALALKLALALDPFSIASPPPPPEVKTTTTATVAKKPRIYKRYIPKRAMRPPRRYVPAEQKIRLEAGATLPLFALPNTVAYGFFGTFGWQYGSGFELDVSFIGLLPSRKDAAEGRISAYSLLGRLALCGRAYDFGFCGIVTSGATMGTGRGFPVNRRGAAFQLGAGAQISYDIEFLEGFGIRLLVAGEGMFVRARLRVDEETLWTMPPGRVEIAVSHWVSF